MKQKDEKLREVIRVLAAEFFLRESNRTSLITITNVELHSRNSRATITNVELHSRNSRATIMFTVMPETQEAAALDFMTRQLSDFREYVGNHARMMRVPFFEVAIDKGEKNRQRIEEIENSVGM